MTDTNARQRTIGEARREDEEPLTVRLTAASTAEITDVKKKKREGGGINDTLFGNCPGDLEIIRRG